MKINKNSLILRGVFTLLFVLGIVACGGEKPNTTPSPSTNKAQQSQLSLNKATLEQSNSKGQTLWKIEVESAAYSPDNKKAQVTNVKGNLFQDGKRILEISSKEGEIYRDGEEIILKKNIVAVDPRNGIVINADHMRWQPKLDLLTVSKNFNATHNDLEITANEGRYQARKQELELVGKIQGVSRKSQIQLKTENLKWLVGQNQVIGDRLLEFTRYQDKTVMDQLKTKRMVLNVKENTVLSQETLTFKSFKPPVQIVGNNFLWNYRDRFIKSQEPIQIVNYKEQVTLTANEGYFDQVKQYVSLKGGVKGKSSRNQTEIYAEEATWYMDNKKVEAIGKVTYKQNNPKMHLTGDHAVGNIQENQVIVTSNSGNKVFTEIFPEKKPN